MHRLCIRRHTRLERPARAQHHVQRRLLGSALGSPRHVEAVLQPALIVDEPLLHIRIPLVAEALALRLHRWLPSDRRLLLSETVTAQFQAPLPIGALRFGGEATPIKLSAPLLPFVLRLPGSAFDRLEAVLPGRVRRADAGPVGFLQPRRHFVRGGGGESADRGPGSLALLDAGGGQGEVGGG